LATVVHSRFRLASALERRGIHYGWAVAGVSFLTLITAAGFRSTAGVLIVPLQDEFGWSRATISAAVSINLVLYGLGGPFAAGLYDRIGVRRVIAGALVVIAASSTLTTQMHSPWQLDLLWGVANGLATGAIGVTLAAVIANRWFKTRRGLVTGMLTASNATGQLVFLPLLAWVVTAHGWRMAALVVSSVAMVIVLPLVLLFLRDRPTDIGLLPYGATEADPVVPLQNPFGAAVRGLVEATRSRTFWLLTASFFVCGATTNGLIGTHLIPAAMDHGVSEVAAASLLATIGVFDLVGTLCSGWLTDRFDPRWLLFWYYGLRGLSLLALPFVIGSTNLGLIAFIVFYGLDWVATVPPTVALTANAFGRERVGVVFGWIFGAHQLGAAMAAWGAGAARTWLGDYQTAFVTAGLLSLVASGLVIRIAVGERPDEPARRLEPADVPAG
jgi:sugar phosphate permease